MLKTLPALAALAAAAALLLPTLSHAQEMDSVRVSYADLNLGSAPGRDALQQRIGFAATYVCGPSDHRDIPMTIAVGECRTATIADARPQFEAAVARYRHGTVEVLTGAALIVTAR